MHKNHLKGNVLLLITALIWGGAFVAQSAAMDYIEPFTYNGIRTVLGGIGLLPIIAALDRCGKKDGGLDKKASRKIRKNTIIGGIYCGIVLCLASSLQQFGVAQTTAGKAGFITALYVVIVPLMSVFIGKKIPKIIWFCVVLVIGGFYLLTMSESLSLGQGDFLVLCCAVVFSLHIMVIDYFNGKGVDGVRMSCFQFFVAGTIMLVLMCIFEHPDWEMIMQAKWTILYSGIMSCGVAYTLQILGQNETEPAVATLIMSLESVFSVLFGWLILGESLTLKEFLGCCLVFIAVILAQVPIVEIIKKKMRK